MSKQQGFVVVDQAQGFVVVDKQASALITVCGGGVVSSGGSVSGYREPVSVFNGGAPEIVFDQYGDVVTYDAT